MKYPAVVTPPTIYNGCSTRKKFRTDKFTPVEMKNCGRRNVRSHKEIKKIEQYIILDIYLELGISDKREVSSLGPKYSVERLGKGMTNSMTINTRRR